MTSLLDQDVFYVPLDCSNNEVAKAFSTSDPNVIRRAQREQLPELASVVRATLHWFIEQDIPQERLSADLLASTFGASLRQGLPDEVLAARHGCTMEDWQHRKDDLKSAGVVELSDGIGKAKGGFTRGAARVADRQVEGGSGDIASLYSSCEYF